MSIDGAEVAHLGPGDIVGEMAVLNHSARTATVTAVTDITAFVVTPRVLTTLVHEPGVAGRFADLVAGRTR